jgi:hypothetical protein
LAVRRGFAPPHQQQVDRIPFVELPEDQRPMPEAVVRR